MMFRVTLVFQEPNQAKKVARFDDEAAARNSCSEELRRYEDIGVVKHAFIDDLARDERHIYSRMGTHLFTVPLSAVAQHMI